MTRREGTLIKPWMRELTAPFRGHAIIALVLGVMATACSALLMFVAGYLICKTAQPSTTLFMVMVPVALVQLFGIGRPLARYFERLVSHDCVFRVTSRLRMLLFDAIETRCDDPTAKRDTGAYLEMLTDDIGHLQNLYLRVAFPIVIALLLLVSATVFCGFFSLGVGVAFFLFAAISTLLLPCAAYFLAKPLQIHAQSLISAEYSRLTDDIIGATDWSLANRTDEALIEHAQSGKRTMDGASAVRRLVRIAELVSSLLLACGMCAIIYVSAESFQTGDSTNLVAAFALGLFPVGEAFALLPGALVDSHRHADALERLDSVIDDSSSNEPARTIQVTPSSTSNNTAVGFYEVTYRYPNSNRCTISHLNFVIPTGQKVAVLGQSGSGKTTVARLLRGALKPTEGTVLVGGVNADERETAPLVCSIPQSPHIFDLTLRENLLIAKPDANDDDLLDALCRVGLESKLASLKYGLDTHIGDTGIGFSGGEAHRLALARALLVDYPIMLLDEPFTALDPTTESALLGTLLDVFADKTLIVITHHLTGIESFDRVVFIEDGQIALDDTPTALLRDSKRFRKLMSYDRFIEDL